MQSNKVLDEPLPTSSLENLAQIYSCIPPVKQQEISSQFGGHRQQDFYQGMALYLFAAARGLEEHSSSLAESASALSCAIADGLLHQNFGKKQNSVSYSVFDGSMGDDDFRKALRTRIPPSFLERNENLYTKKQSLAFYEGMFRAAALVFTTAYKRKEVKQLVLDNMIWNYAYLAKIISQKRRVS